MTHPLDTAFEKVRRADQHIDELAKQVGALHDPAQRQVYSARTKVENEQIQYRPISEHLLKQYGISLSELFKPPLMINEGIVLMPFLVQEVSCRLDVKIPFPLTHFERLQPYHDGENPHLAPLWILQELWNGDKHRSVAVVADWAGTKKADLTNFNGLQEFAAARWISYHQFTPIEDGAEFARVEMWWFPIKGVEDQNSAVDMYIDLVFGIAFDDDSPAPRRDVIVTLQTISREVRAILDRFSPFF